MEDFTFLLLYLQNFKNQKVDVSLLPFILLLYIATIHFVILLLCPKFTTSETLRVQADAAGVPAYPDSSQQWEDSALPTYSYCVKIM